jgi:hypothetical protein
MRSSSAITGRLSILQGQSWLIAFGWPASGLAESGSDMTLRPACMSASKGKNKRRHRTPLLERLNDGFLDQGFARAAWGIERRMAAFGGTLICTV